MGERASGNKAMRPRLNILLYCSEPDKASVYSFIIETKGNQLRRGFRAWRAGTLAEAETLWESKACGFFDAFLVFATWETDDQAKDVCALATLRGVKYVSVDLIAPGQATIEEWLIQLRTACEKKRGPKRKVAA
jgi:hypothetical protein